MTDLAQLGLSIDANGMDAGIKAAETKLKGLLTTATEIAAKIHASLGGVGKGNSQAEKAIAKERLANAKAAAQDLQNQENANRKIQLNSAVMTGNAIVSAHNKQAAAEVAIEKKKAQDLAAIDAARAKQAMSMRMQPILSTGSQGLPTKATSAFNEPAAPLYTASGIASVDKMRESLARLRVEEAALHAARQAGTISHLEYARGMDGITKATNLAVAGNTRARGVFRQTASAIASATFEITGAIYGLGAAVGILSAPAAFGFKLLSTLEQTKLGMAAILVSMGEINGEAVKLPIALEAAAGMTQRLQENALKYGVNVATLADTTRSIMAPGLGAGLNLQEIEKIALAGSIAVKTIGLDSRQAVQEIRDLVAGGIQAASSTLARSLGINDQMVKDWTKAGTLYQNLMERLAGFQDTAILNTETLSGAWDIFVQKVQLAFANSVQFDAFKQKLVDLSNWIGKIDVNSGKFKFNQDIINSVTAYYEGFKATLDTLAEVGRFVSLLGPVIQTLAVLLVNTIYVLRMFAGEVKTIATQLVALAHLDFKNFKLIGSDWKKEAEAARIEVDRLSRSILGVKEAQAGGSKLLGKWGAGAGSGWSKVDPALFITGKSAGAEKDKPGRTGTADPQIAFMAGLRKEAETLGMSEEALKRYEVSKTKLSAANRRLADTYVTTIFAFKAEQEAAKLANEEAQKAIEVQDELIKASHEKVASVEKEIDQIQFETSLLGMNTGERYKAIAAREVESNIYTQGNEKLAERLVLLAKEQEYNSRIKSLLGNTQKSKTDDFMADVAAADRFRFDGGDQAQADEMIKNVTDASDKAKEKMGEMDVFAKKMAENIQQSMSDFLFDPFNNGLDGMLKGFGTMLQRMIADAVAADLAKKMFGGLSDDGATGGSGWVGAGLDWLGGLFKSANGNAFSGGHAQAFASGGILGANGGMLTHPTLFPMANGGLGIGGEAGIEAVMPLKRGSDGKLGVAAGGGGGSRNNITVVVQGGQSAPDVRRAAGQGAREALGMLNGTKRYG